MKKSILVWAQGKIFKWELSTHNYKLYQDCLDIVDRSSEQRVACYNHSWAFEIVTEPTDQEPTKP